MPQKKDLLTSLVDQLNTLYTIHRLLNDGQWHVVQEIADSIKRKPRQTFEYIHLLKNLKAPILSCPGKGYRYHPFPYQFDITESFIRSAIAKMEFQKERHDRMSELGKKHGKKKELSLSKVLVPEQI